MAEYLVWSSSFTLLLALSILTRWRKPGGVPFIGTLLGIAIYGFGYAMELMALVPSDGFFWNHVQYLGSAFVPVFWAWLSLEVYRGEPFRSPGIPLVLLAFPLATLILNWTNSAHHLYYLAQSYTRHDGLTLASLVPGPWYFVQVVITLLCFFLGLGFFVATWARRGLSNGMYTLGFLLAGVPALTGFLAYLTGTSLGLDLVPLGLSVSAFFLFIILWPFRHAELAPITRDAVFRLLSDPVLVVVRQSTIVDWNPAAQRLFLALVDQKPPVDLPKLLESNPGWPALWKSASQGGEVWLDHSGPPESKWTLNRTAFPPRRGRPAFEIALFHEQTQLIASAETFEHLSMTDELTGCWNRRALLERAPRLPGSTVIAIDLDHFKRVNDQWGHSAGDQVLKHAVGQWQSQLRTADVLARVGGEEFVVLLPATPISRGVTIASRLRQSLLSHPVEWEGQRIPVTASFGVSSVLTGDAPLDTLLHSADVALYEAKRRGRNQVVLGDPVP